MTTRGLIEAIGQALVSDAQLAAWCNEQFGRPPIVFIGVDESDPPGEADYPLVAVIGIDQVRGIGEHEERWILSLGVGVVNEDLPQGGPIRTRAGFLQAETMRELAENAVFRARILPSRSSGEASTRCYHPLYVSYTEISFRMLQAGRW